MATSSKHDHKNVGCHRLVYAQAATLADLLEPFRKTTIDSKRPEGFDG